MLATRLATPQVPLLEPFVPAHVFDGFGHARLTDLEWRRPDLPDRWNVETAVTAENPARMVFVMHAECTFLPRELACLHATGMGLENEWALAPYGIDDATDAFYERKLAPRDYLWLAADNLPALVWGLHDWAHFHHHGPFTERALTELQCDVSALVWMHLNRESIGLTDARLEKLVKELESISRDRFESEGKKLAVPFFDPAYIASLALTVS